MKLGALSEWVEDSWRKRWWERLCLEQPEVAKRLAKMYPDRYSADRYGPSVEPGVPAKATASSPNGG